MVSTTANRLTMELATFCFDPPSLQVLNIFTFREKKDETYSEKRILSLAKVSMLMVYSIH